MSASTYQIISVISFSIAAILFVLAVILFVVMNIPRIIGDLTGKTAMKQIKKMRMQNNGVQIKQNYHNVLNSDRAVGMRKTYDSKKLKTTSDKLKNTYGKTNSSMQKTADMKETSMKPNVQSINVGVTVPISQAFPNEQSIKAPENIDYKTGLLQEPNNQLTEVLKESKEPLTTQLHEFIDYKTGLLSEEPPIIENETNINNTDIYHTRDDTLNQTITQSTNQSTNQTINQTQVLADNGEYSNSLMSEENISKNIQSNISNDENQSNNIGDKEMELDPNATTELSQSLQEQDQKSDQAIQPLFFKKKTTETYTSDETTELHIDENEWKQQEKVNQQTNKGNNSFVLIRSIVIVNSKETIE